LLSNSHYETNFGVCSAYGAANPKIGFLKAQKDVAHAARAPHLFGLLVLLCLSTQSAS